MRRRKKETVLKNKKEKVKVKGRIKKSKEGIVHLSVRTRWESNDSSSTQSEKK